MPTDGLHRLAPGDVPSLIPLVQAAAAAGDLAGSSEPNGMFFLRDLEREPDLVAVAWERGEPVGFISPEFKMLVVEEEGFERVGTRERWARPVDG